MDNDLEIITDIKANLGEDPLWDSRNKILYWIAIIDGAGDAIVKIVLKTCYLADGEKIKVCHLAEDLRAEFVKTSIGFGTLGATPEDVRLMRKIVSPHIRVKAAWGIRNLDAAIEIFEAGAHRIRATRTAEIIEEWRAEQKNL